ncbi:universal stress protein [Bosea psychrotolerans]|uniref:Nucleotide-binding universal stress UspA family protein n=1 Tax=Bosea psychrotolerans TaxID=1871628 RepID=A0A2S4ML71_9HYPH|nr:universal stress protein [Bosea psychrotolerans]POR55534.1 nucleotide-binding universal stress UspA family protein [Bosea psychrotolerans]
MAALNRTAGLSTFASLMVPVHLGGNAEGPIRLAASLAERFTSRLIGVAAAKIAVPYYGDSISSADTLLRRNAEQTAGEEIARAETVFRRTAGNSSATEWRSSLSEPRDFILSQSRAADLLVIGRQGADDADQGHMAVSANDLVMDLGRPILLVPPQLEHLAAKRIVIAWKDTREARRAVWDALPFLMRAELVWVASVGPGANEQGLADVCTYLAEHRIAARSLVRSDSSESDAREIIDIAQEQGADLIVAGAYGHSRMREWLFGGMTRELLDTTPLCCLISH